MQDQKESQFSSASLSLLHPTRPVLSASQPRPSLCGLACDMRVVGSEDLVLEKMNNSFRVSRLLPGTTGPELKKKLWWR